MLFVAFLKSQDKLVCVFLIQNHQRKQLHGPVWLAKGRSQPITSDFSDRKLGENLRKWLSGPTHKTELACAAAEENKHSFQVHKHNDSSVCACISAFPFPFSYNKLHVEKRSVCPASSCVGDMTKHRGNNTV